MSLKEIFIEKLNNANTPLEAENILEKICKTDYINDEQFMNKIECCCDFKQFHLKIHYKDLHAEPNIEIGQEVFWGQDADTGSLNTDGYYAGYILGYGHVTEIRETSIIVDTYGEIHREALEFTVFPGIRMLYMYLNADGIRLFKLDGTVKHSSFIAGFTDAFPENIKETIINQIN